MSFLKWNENFETGLYVIDCQHKKLVELINKFGSEITNNNIDDIHKILNELSSYALYHFTEEENMMEKYGLSKDYVKKHNFEHENFISYISHITDSTSILNELQLHPLFDFLVNWLVTHILCCDKRMAIQISLIKEGINPNKYHFDEELAYNKAIDILQSSIL